VELVGEEEVAVEAEEVAAFVAELGEVLVPGLDLVGVRPCRPVT
jgi:hypothetical protein